jgi:Na+-translocating ferredoxin:NAD+ oxidoreductase subunit D
MGDPRRPGTHGLTLSPAPHLGTSSTTAGMSWLVAASLLPAVAWGVLLNGLAGIPVVVTALVSALAAEALVTVPFGRFTLLDGTAALTGLLVGMMMPAGIAPIVPAAASVFAIVVVKQSFGGLGRNWMNPAVGGTLFALLSWGAAMGTWSPLAASGAVQTPLAALRAAMDSTTGGGGPLALLGAGGYPFSHVDASVLSWVNAHLLGPLGISAARGTFDIFTGLVLGPVGASSTPLIVAAGVILAGQRIVTWEAPVSSLAVFFTLVLVSTGSVSHAAFQVLSGSAVLGAFFLASDPVTSPLARPGRWIYGVILGLLLWVLRSWGVVGDGVIVALALANAFVPLIDGATLRRKGLAFPGRTP